MKALFVWLLSGIVGADFAASAALQAKAKLAPEFKLLSDSTPLVLPDNFL